MSGRRLRRLPYMAVVTTLAGLVPLVAGLVLSRVVPAPETPMGWRWTYLFSLPAIVLLGSVSIFLYPAYRERSRATSRALFLATNVLGIDAVVASAVLFTWGWPWA